MEKITLEYSPLFKQCLKDQVILITGASDGIGRALSLQAAQEGATVILIGRSIKKLESLFDEIVNNGHPTPFLYPFDLLQLTPETAKTIYEEIKAQCGKLNALVHNAAMIGSLSPIEYLSALEWQKVIYVNLHVPYLLTQNLLPLLKETDNSSILFTLSNESQQNKAYWSAYGASKAGLMALAQTLHEEVEVNTSLRINCIHPPCVLTNLQKNAYPGRDNNSQLPKPETIMNYYIQLLQPTSHLRGKFVAMA